MDDGIVPNIQDYYVVSGTFLCLESISSSIYHKWMITLQKWLASHLSLSSLELIVKYCHGPTIREANEAVGILHRYFLSNSLLSIPTVARQYVKDQKFYGSLIDALQERNNSFSNLTKEEQENCIVFYRSVVQLFDYFLLHTPNLISFFLKRKILQILCSGLQCFLCYYDPEFSESDTRAVEEMRMIHISHSISPSSIFTLIHSILRNRRHD